MARRTKALASVAAAAALAFCVTAILGARGVSRKAAGIRPGATLAEVLQQLDGWAMINTHAAGRRAIPNGTGPEFNGYSGRVYVLTPVTPDGRETDRRKISREDFDARLEAMVNGGEPWLVYFSFPTIPTRAGILVRFDGRGRVMQP